MSLPILSTLVFLPLLGALFASLSNGNEPNNARRVSIFFSLVTFVLSLALWWKFDAFVVDYQFVESYKWFETANIRFDLGVDGGSLFFVILSCFLFPMVFLLSKQSIKKQLKSYVIAMLILESLVLGSFLAMDIFLFYIFFEAVLIPMFIMIGVWGGERRIYASIKFFLYTLLGSVLMLIALVMIYYQAGNASMMNLKMLGFSSTENMWLWFALFAAFAVKIPMWPVHTWLPDAHVEAPTGGSVILAAILLKLGGYGFFRLSLMLFPEPSQTFSNFVLILSVIAVIYTSLVAIAQQDMKKLIAYSSIAHMGFVTAGIFSNQMQAMTGAMFQMLSHGVVSAALFFTVGILYDRFHTREIANYGGIVKLMPLFSGFVMLFTMASVGLPGTSGFVGEFLVILGLFETHSWAAILISLSLVLGAVYMLNLYKKVYFGNASLKLGIDYTTGIERVKTKLKLSKYETIILTSLALVMLWLGIAPQPVLDISRRFVRMVYLETHINEQVK